MNESSLRNNSSFYVASRARIPERAAMWRSLRDEREVDIVSSWIDLVSPDGKDLVTDMTFLWQRIQMEIDRCNCLVLYVEKSDLPIRGALVEVGMALASQKLVRILAPDLKLGAESQKALGTWVAHPNVTIVDSVEEAFSRVPVPFVRYVR